MCCYLFLGVLGIFQELNRYIYLVDSQYRTFLLVQETLLDILEYRCVAINNIWTYSVIKMDIHNDYAFKCIITDLHGDTGFPLLISNYLFISTH